MSTLTKGIDISAWQRSLPNVAGTGFVILRATYATFTDSRFRAHHAAAKARGLAIGAYHFGVRFADVGDQLDAFVRSINLVSPAPKLLVLDVERDGDRPRMTDSQARDFLARLKARVPGCRTVLYMSEWEFRDLGQDADWVANWSREPKWRWELWQYRGTPIDLNHFNGSESEMRAFFAGVPPLPLPKPSPRPTTEIPRDGDEPMLNLAPGQTHRDAVLKAGTVMRTAPRANAHRYSRVEDETALGFVGGGYGSAVDWIAVNNGGRGVYVAKADVARYEPNIRTTE